MKTNISKTTLAVAVSLTIGMALLLHATLARSESSKTQAKQVTVDNFSFGPETLTVPANSTVTWINKDDVPHVIASDDGVFRSKALDTEDKYSYTFTKPGTYPYYCSVHPKMVGKVIVK